MEPDRRELEKVPTFLLVLFLLYKPFWLGTGLLERRLVDSLLAGSTINTMSNFFSSH